ncbi:MAG: hypothetical protein ACRD2U_06175 [Terriglobales bacterium]
MDRRRNPRVEAVLPVRVWGLDANTMPFMETARATSISSAGALIQGLRRQVRLGEVLDVQLGEEKSQFRVVWIGKAGTRKSGSLGIESTETETCLWDINIERCGQIAAEV